VMAIFNRHGFEQAAIIGRPEAGSVGVTVS
jgi:hypothetical protein